ncbi:bridge-like lipid transfer protein family member 1 isoform X3 [Convolutriloba macropyga]|uniref:bridge-like lipid transfer protein family member 1 isoform X3 n=1 Tax=Convolutriloba macropyga TaxID=536237 RepID=UPI003F51AE27
MPRHLKRERSVKTAINVWNADKADDTREHVKPVVRHNKKSSSKSSLTSSLARKRRSLEQFKQRKSVSKLSRGSSPLEHLPFVSGNRTSSLNIFSNTQPKDSDAKLMTRGATLSRKRSLGESLRNLSPTANLRGTQPRVNVGDDRIGNELLMTTMKDSSTNKSVSGNDTSEAQWETADEEDDDVDQLDTCAKHIIQSDYNASNLYSGCSRTATPQLSQQATSFPQDMGMPRMDNDVMETCDSLASDEAIKSYYNNEVHDEGSDYSTVRDQVPMDPYDIDSVNRSLIPPSDLRSYPSLPLSSHTKGSVDGDTKMALRLDFDIAVSSGECMLHADIPEGSNQRTHMKGRGRPLPNVSNIRIPAINVLAFYNGETDSDKKDETKAECKESQKSSDNVFNRLRRISERDYYQHDNYSSHGSDYTSGNNDKNANGVPRDRSDDEPAEKGQRCQPYSEESENDFVTVKSSLSVPKINVLRGDHESSPKEGTIPAAKSSISRKSSSLTVKHEGREVVAKQLGKLYVWIVVQKSEDQDPLMRLSPSFLDYIQQVLNNLTAEKSGDVSLLQVERESQQSQVKEHAENGGVGKNGVKAKKKKVGEKNDSEKLSSTSGSSKPKVIVSRDITFPVDIVVALYVCVQIESFEVNIDCYPFDKIACIMLLPQTNIVFSSVRTNLAALEEYDLVTSNQQHLSSDGQSDYATTISTDKDLQLAAAYKARIESSPSPPPRRSFFAKYTGNKGSLPEEIASATKETTPHEELTSSNIGGVVSSRMFSNRTQLGDASGWVVTVVADDFSVYVCHQFNLNTDEPRGIGGGGGTYGYGYGDSSRKDAFSLSVKSVRFNMCHNSTLHFNDPSIVVKKSNEHEHKFTGDNDEYQLLPNKTPSPAPSFKPIFRNPSSSSTSSHRRIGSIFERHRFVNLSMILDFGECRFKFDFRKLAELRTFLKYWYRKQLIQQAFIATDENMDSYWEMGDPLDGEINSGIYSETDAISADNDRQQNMYGINRISPKPWGNRAKAVGRSTPESPQHQRRRLSHVTQSPVRTKRRSTHLYYDIKAELFKLPRKQSFKASLPFSNKNSTRRTGTFTNVKWESNVKLAINFPSVEVSLQLDSFLGSVSVKTEKLVGKALLHLTSDKRKVAFTKMSLGKSELSSKTATFSPNLLLQDCLLSLSMKRLPQRHPTHSLRLRVKRTELKLNYRTMPILMGRFVNVKFTFSDYWVLESGSPFKLDVKAHLNWDTAEMLGVNSTISDLIIIKKRLVHIFSSYFSQKSDKASYQGSSSNRGSGVSSGYRGLSFGSGGPHYRRPSMDSGHTGSHQKRAVDWKRHWPQVVSHVLSGTNKDIRIIASHITGDSSGTVDDVILSGEAEVKGRRLAVILMETDIKSSLWLVLHLTQPLASFTTECRNDGLSSNVLSVEQVLTARLLHDITSKIDKNRDSIMAEIRLCHRVGDNSCPIMAASSVTEWVAHTLQEETHASTAIPPPRVPGYRRNSNPVYERAASVRGGYKIENSLIASLPRLQAKLRTEQGQTIADPVTISSFDNNRSSFLQNRKPSQAAFSPPGGHQKPRVDCHFTTQFSMPLQVSLDPQYLEMFKKLIKDCGDRIRIATADQKGMPSSLRKMPKPGDPREYSVVEWIFDPSLKFITATTSSTDPPGINWLWKKLGVENCKHTLPKFAQRFLMDNLDAAVALTVLYDIRKLSKLQNQLPDVVQK